MHKGRGEVRYQRQHMLHRYLGLDAREDEAHWSAEVAAHESSRERERGMQAQMATMAAASYKAMHMREPGL